jgi:hypothetical protein
MWPARTRIEKEKRIWRVVGAKLLGYVIPGK